MVPGISLAAKLLVKHLKLFFYLCNVNIHNPYITITETASAESYPISIRSPCGESLLSRVESQLSGIEHILGCKTDSPDP